MSNNHYQAARQPYLDKAQRVVIKVGSAVLSSGNCMDLAAISNIAAGLSFLHQKGKEVILVSSGAVAAGKKKLGYGDAAELSLEEKQALAAVGQSHLMHMYDEAFLHHGANIAQLLLTHADLSHRDRYLNFKNTLFTLLRMGVIPIINENDTVSTEELQFGDNDNLAALVSNLIEADLFICLTDVDCLYSSNPETDKNASQIHLVAEVTEEILSMAGHSKSILGTGGMRSKILAAKKVAAGGGASLIGPGKKEEIIQKLFGYEGVGTFFLPRRKRLQGRKQWIAFVLKPKGKLYLDSGACTAVRAGGKSLLPSGVVSLEGSFMAGDSVECVDENGRVFAVGLSNYRREDVERLLGHHSREILDLLGFKGSDELIHRDNLVLL